MDIITPQQRSVLMSKVRSKDTLPELAVRRFLHRAGFRFRVHARDLPGKPDLVLPRHRIAVFVHGCFWHRHPNCRKATTPASNRRFWAAKFAANKERDKKARRSLRLLGWTVVTVWECQTGDIRRLSQKFTPLDILEVQ